MSQKPTIGIALGGGAARGWAHIGVLKALAEQGVVPDVVSGASVGSLVGAAFAAGRLDALEKWVRGLNRLDVLKLLDARWKGSMIEGNRVMQAIETILTDREIRDLPKPFGAVATDLATGRAIWLRQGSMIDAIRASSAMPVIMAPKKLDEMWLLDGGLVDPVPVTLCRLLGADIVIAVNLTAYRHRSPGARPAPAKPAQAEEQTYTERLQRFVYDLFDADDAEDGDDPEPALLDIVSASINIMQERISRSRLAGDPPDVQITPQLQGIGLMDFHLARQAIELGYDATSERAAELSRIRPAEA